MSTREQEARVAQICIANGGEAVCVREGFADKSIRATLRNGREYVIDEDGRIIGTDLNFSVRWQAA
jgi:hypothetical protein